MPTHNEQQNWTIRNKTQLLLRLQRTARSVPQFEFSLSNAGYLSLMRYFRNL